MTAVACSLNAADLAAQLERYRAIGRLAAAIEHDPGRVLVRFADDPPSALIERTLEVERGCCPFFVIDYDPVTRHLAISADDLDRRPAVGAIARALAGFCATEQLRDGAHVDMRTVSGVASCCSPTALETCCEPQDKHYCCGQASAGESTVAAPSRCRCRR